MKMKIEIEVDHEVVEMVNYALAHPFRLSKDVDTKMLDEFREKLLDSFLKPKEDDDSRAKLSQAHIELRHALYEIHENTFHAETFIKKAQAILESIS